MGEKKMSWRAIRLEVIRRANSMCELCGKSDVLLDAHHKTPRRLGGNDSLNNLMAVCQECHPLVESWNRFDNPELPTKMIKVQDKTHQELDKLGVRGETFDAIINKCIKSYKKEHGL